LRTGSLAPAGPFVVAESTRIVTHHPVDLHDGQRSAGHPLEGKVPGSHRWQAEPMARTVSHLTSIHDALVAKRVVANEEARKEWVTWNVKHVSGT
jgi:hypothetical protein